MPLPGALSPDGNLAQQYQGQQDSHTAPNNKHEECVKKVDRIRKACQERLDEDFKEWTIRENKIIYAYRKLKKDKLDQDEKLKKLEVEYDKVVSERQKLYARVRSLQEVSFKQMEPACWMLRDYNETINQLGRIRNA